jgi:ribonucleoside-diphosphate reductase alpha chain
VTVLAPTGTIAFMMDCDTTGIEPDIALVKYKKLVGGGTLKIVNQAVPAALSKLGYSPQQIGDITGYIDQNDTIEGAPHLKDAHLSVFDCAFRPANGTRSIHYLGHLKMMAAAQPFLSGAISKTVNLPNEATVEDIAETFEEAWRLGIKAVAIYRDGCKRSQPLSTKKEKDYKGAELAPDKVVERIVEKVVEREVMRPFRKKLPDERQAITHKFSIAGHEGYITVGMYEDGTPGEVFITMAKEGSTLSGMMDAFATSVSLALQYGVPLQVLCDKFTATRFEPSGFTGNRDIPMAKSITDYIFRWLALKFLQTGENAEPNAEPVQAVPTGTTVRVKVAAQASSGGSGGDVRTQQGDGTLFKAHMDSPLCSNCGRMMFPSGACYRCDCGATSGGCS